MIDQIQFYELKKSVSPIRRATYPKEISLTKEQQEIVIKYYNDNPKADKRSLADRLFISYEKLMKNLVAMGEMGLVNYKKRLRKKTSA